MLNAITIARTSVQAQLASAKAIAKAKATATASQLIGLDLNIDSKTTASPSFSPAANNQQAGPPGELPTGPRSQQEERKSGHGTARAVTVASFH